LAPADAMNWSITTWAPLAKSPNCASQMVRALGVRGRVAVLEAEHGLLGQDRVDHREVRLVLVQVAQRYVAGAVVLVAQHGVAVEEGAAARVLARRSGSGSPVEQGGVGHVLGEAPVGQLVAVRHQAAVLHDALHPRDAG
jgi:hypothetical protein